GTADSLRAAPRRLALVSYADGARETVGTAFASELRAQGHTVSTIRLHAESGPAAFDSARALIDRSPMTVFAVSVRPVDSKGSIALPPEINRLIDSTAGRKPMLLASFGSPYIIMETPRVRSYLLGWNTNPASERAAARALSGAPITGRLPISIPPVFRLGEGFVRPATDSWGGGQW